LPKKKESDKKKKTKENEKTRACLCSEIKKGLEGIRERSAAASERWQARLY
jgi:hypothetical protein